MARWFHPSTNAIARASLIAMVVLLIALGCLMWGGENSSYVTGQQIMLEQPIPFSHEHHVGGLGIDCRYCHTSVADSSFAGLPPTKTCMTCHSQIWTNAEMLEPVRESWRTGVPIRWQRVNTVPEYVYFDHSIHIQKGVGCATCHGKVNEMPLMQQNASLQMSWCLNCHRKPEQFLRPREEVFSMNYQPPDDQLALGKELCQRYHVRSSQALTDCYTCHR
jgi:ferredoxin